MPGTLPFVQAALRASGAAHPTSPLFLSSSSVALVSGHGGVPPWPSRTRLSRSPSRFCGARPLRPHAALLHNAAFCKVFASRCAKAPLGVAHRCAPSRVCKTGVMQSGLRLVRARQPSALPGRWRALRTAGRSPLVAAVAAGHWSGASRFVLVSGPSASPGCCSPPPTRRGLAAARHWPPRRLPVRPPGGSLSRRGVRGARLTAR